MQKTAYEMRINDWSSDVSSSALRVGAGLEGLGQLVGVRGLDVHELAGPGRLGRGDRLGDAEQGQVVVLEHDPLGEVAAVVHRSARPHSSLLEGAQARCRLAGVPDAISDERSVV